MQLPRMKHPNILECIGVEKHLDKSEYWLITAYHPYGSLCDYLKAHTVTWPELCKIAESMARGLMHLHEEIPASKMEGLKPAISHRYVPLKRKFNIFTYENNSQIGHLIFLQ